MQKPTLLITKLACDVLCCVKESFTPIISILLLGFVKPLPSLGCGYLMMKITMKKSYPSYN